MSINIVVLHGRLADDPELKKVGKKKDTSMCSFDLAVSRSVSSGSGQDTDFLRVTAFGSTADLIARHCHKGKEILIHGTLRRDKVEGGGETRYYTKIIAESFDFCGRKDDSRSDASAGSSFPAGWSPEF